MARGYKLGENKNCLICSKEFYAKKGEIKKGGGKYCSQKCYHESRIGLSSWNKGIPMRDDIKKKLSKRFMGSKNHQWKGGITEYWSRVFKTFEYKQWRKCIYERDNFTCRSCGVKGNGKNLNAHHILRRETHPHLVFSIDNGITLCKICHTKEHAYFMRSKMKINKVEQIIVQAK